MFMVIVLHNVNVRYHFSIKRYKVERCNFFTGSAKHPQYSTWIIEALVFKSQKLNDHITEQRF